MAVAKKKASLNVVAPEVLPDRPMLQAHTYQSVGEGFSLDTVGVSFAKTKAGRNTYKAPTGDSEPAAIIRDYVLIRSRYDLPYAEKRAKQWHVSEHSIETANRIFANVRYRHAFDEDPSVGTVDTTLLSAYLSEGNPPKQAILAAMSHVCTDAFLPLMRSITDPDIKMQLSDFESTCIDLMYDGYRRYGTLLAGINDPNDWRRKRSVKYWKQFAEWVDNSADNVVREAGERKAEKEQKKALDRPAKAHPKRDDLIGNWEQLVVSKPELSINHTGKLGRRTIANDSGREPRYINRIVTDPDRRIFSRKTRALGGVVVIDASGSMQLSEDDLDRLLKCSAGATVIMYSGGINKSTHPNTWLIAKKGRMVRKLPDVPGNNCVDGPALIYGASLRERSSQPLIWVSDGEVTGAAGNSSNHNLLKDIEYIKSRYRVQQVMNVTQAEKLMRRLQGGKR